MHCYECDYLDRSMVLTSYPPQMRCTIDNKTHIASHICEYDIVPVVRCKNCIYNPDKEEKNNIYCSVTDLEWGPNDFCSAGRLDE